MTKDCRNLTPAVTAGDDDVILVSESSQTELELARRKLRQRWELASVLNFLSVFEPVIQIDLKISAEEIETSLINPNNALANLHIKLLKGIPPVSKTLNGDDAWVTALCKKLAMWWPWVAEGVVPLTAVKGEEILRYKELDPTSRLMILKALCEIRADQHDIVSFINDAVKHGTEVSAFRKHKIVGDGNGIAYWYDGNATIGHRLYKEVNEFESKTKTKGKEAISTINCQWDTLATNLEEFRKVVDGFSSSEVRVEVAVAKAVATDAIPVLVKLQKKKERALKRVKRQETLNGFRNSGISRSFRNRRPVSYIFDEYDRAIDEALEVIKKRAEVQRHEEKHNEPEKRDATVLNWGSAPDTNARNSEYTKSDTESDSLHAGNIVDDSSDNEYDGHGKKDDVDDKQHGSDTEKENSDHGNRNVPLYSQSGCLVRMHRESRCSNKLGGISGHPCLRGQHLGTTNRLRQRPTRNTALESAVIPDSEDESSSKNTSSGTRACENLLPAADSDDDFEN